MTKGLAWHGMAWRTDMGPDDFLKYFISITAERKQSHTRRNGVSLLFKCTTKWDTVCTALLGYELP